MSVHQPLKGYRVSSDAVFLAALGALRPQMRVCDLGTGYGQVALCLLARESSLHIVGVEKNSTAAVLARQNAAHNGFADQFQIHEGDLADYSTPSMFDLVVANPPYRTAKGHDASPNPVKADATIERTPLSVWTHKMADLLAEGGTALMIHDARRLPDILNGFTVAGLGAIWVLPLCSKAGEAAGRVVVKAQRGAAVITTLPDVVLHDEAGAWLPRVKQIMATPTDWSDLWSQPPL